ncbi:hypothetical protein [Streptomyces sp. NPDC059828]|uniref:hypothetical protein n=1 Tax=Streptomyces sp. NPDC059828 TaxID=3346965 RepID=UPI00365A53C7
MLTMRTPIGSIDAEMTFTEHDGALRGVAVGKAETVELSDVRVLRADAGERLTWRQSITKPMRLNLDFDVLVAGDEMHGHSRAGRLPRSRVTGVRKHPGTR